MGLFQRRERERWKNARRESDGEHWTDFLSDGLSAHIIPSIAFAADIRPYNSASRSCCRALTFWSHQEREHASPMGQEIPPCYRDVSQRNRGTIVVSCTALALPFVFSVCFAPIPLQGPSCLLADNNCTWNRRGSGLNTAIDEDRWS